MDLKTFRAVAQQRLTENEWVVHAGLAGLALLGFAKAAAGRRRGAVLALSQVHRTTRWGWMTRAIEPFILANLATIHDEPKRPEKPDLIRHFGHRLAVLKAPGENGEKGVLFVMTSAMFRGLHDGMYLDRMMRDYTLVFEPSWSGYCHPDLLEYAHQPDEVFILAAEEHDYAFLKRLQSNIVPIDFGPCDWVDPRVAEPFLANAKEFDIMMNSNWGAWKRHHVLFRMLRGAKKKYKVALVGVKWSGRFKADIERLARYFGVIDQLTIVEDIPYEQVADLTCRSRVSILLSLKEGSNRAISEGIFCNVPVVVLSNHVGGIRKNVVAQTGVLAPESGLEAAVETLLASNLQPREWGLEHVSCFKSSERLNAILREYALKQGQPWTQDIAGRSNSPDSKYLYDEDRDRLAPLNEGLKDYLR